MRLGSLLRAVFVATVLIFVAVAVYVYAFRFFDWLESDATVPVLLAEKALRARAPIVDDWYYANGDVWLLAPHLFAIPPVALLGISPISLLIANAGGFALEVAVLVRIYRRLADERWVALLAAAATLMAWSNAHVAYAYLQLAYGFGATLFLFVFAAFASLAQEPRPWRSAGLGVLVAVIAVQGPTRMLVYVVAPILVACAWPWRGLATRRRLAIAGTAVAGWLVGYAAYRWWIGDVVAWSIPRGHLDFAFGRVADNLAMFGRGLLILCAGDGSVAWAAPGALVLGGAIALVGREAASRTLGPLRWICLALIAQLALVLGPSLVGTLLDGPEAIRYFIPSFISLVGLAVVIAVRTAREAARAWWRRFAIGWLCAVPIAALVAAREAGPPRPVEYVWPDAPELADVADELVRRGLTHGFAGNLAANLLTLDAKGAALTCRAWIHDILMPERWLAGTECYDAATLPDRFYVVAYQNEADRAALQVTLPPALERFHVGDTYEVHVFRTEPASTAWLALPIADGPRAAFPLRIPASHLQLRRYKAALDGGDAVATGEEGTVVYGPYVELPAGSYVARWLGEGVESPGQLTFRVLGTPRGLRRRSLAPAVTQEARAVPRGPGELVRLAFTARRTLVAVELTVTSAGGARVALHELVIERAAP